MAAKIDGLISNQKYELIRDRLAVVLLEELINQGQLSSPNEVFTKGVWVERFANFDQPTEFPCLNIVLGDGSYSNKDQECIDGEYRFYIVAYESAKTTLSGRGDTLAKIKLHRLLGLCRAILENPIYRTLDFAPPFTVTSKVGAIVVNQPQDTQDATNSVSGYLEYVVKVSETVSLKDAIPLVSSTTTVKLYNTNQGYLWGSADAAPPTMFIDENEEIEVQYFIAE